MSVAKIAVALLNLTKCEASAIQLAQAINRFIMYDYNHTCQIKSNSRQIAPQYNLVSNKFYRCVFLQVLVTHAVSSVIMWFNEVWKS